MEKLGVAQTKTEFIKSIHHWLMETLESHGLNEYKECFQIEGSSIMCTLPPNYFNFYLPRYEIPEGTKIEMKFVTKKG